MSVYIAVALASVAVFAALQAGYWIRAARRSAASELLRARLRISEEDGLLRSRGAEDALTALLVQSGIGWSKATFLRYLVLAVVGCAVVGGVQSGLLGALLLGWLAGAGLYGYLVYARGRRLNLIAQQMPRAIELIIVALRAGHALPRAVSVVLDDIPAPTGTELRRVVEEHALGRPIEECFAGMTRRLPGVMALGALNNGIAVLNKTGGNLVEVLERVVDTAVAQSQFEMRVRALTAENRASGVILALLPPGFAAMASTMTDGYFRVLIEDPLGRTLLLFAFALWLGGVLWIRSLTQIEEA